MLQSLLAAWIALFGAASVPADLGAARNADVVTRHESASYSTPLAAPPHNRLVSIDLGLDTGVGIYADCTRASELTHESAAIDACLPGRNYFIGHNPGVFTPLLAVKVGTTLTYFDGAGTPHAYRVVGVRTWNRFWGSPPFVQPDVTAQFQTCLTANAVWDQILDAVPA
ncbi:MAG: hypothetical protein ABI838_09990 [Chloroflexota bacterium]